MKHEAENDGSDRSVLLRRELMAVLGTFRPGSAPEVYLHSGVDAQYVATHERTHQDLTANTLYGGVLRSFVTRDSSLTLPTDTMASIAEELIKRAWITFEGEATYMELMHVSNVGGIDAAVHAFARLPSDYQCAVNAYCDFHQTLLLPNPSAFTCAQIVAVAEYAMDRSVARIADHATSVKELGLAIVANAISPDQDLDSACDAMGTVMSRLIETFDQTFLNEWLFSSEERDVVAHGRFFRSAVERFKLAMAACDTFPDAEASDPEAFTSACLRSQWGRLTGHSYADFCEEEALINDAVTVQSSPNSEITIQPIRATPDGLPQKLEELIGTDSAKFVSLSGDRIQAFWTEDIFPQLSEERRSQQLQSMLQRRAVEQHEGVLRAAVDVAVMKIDGKGAMMVEHHLLTYATDDELAELAGSLLRRYSGRIFYTTLAIPLHGQLKWDLPPAILDMPAFVYLIEYGSKSFMSVVEKIGPPKVFWLANFVDTAHVVGFGQPDGPMFLSLGPGAAESAYWYERKLGVPLDAQVPSEEMLRICWAAAVLRYRSVFLQDQTMNGE